MDWLTLRKSVEKVPLQDWYMKRFSSKYLTKNGQFTIIHDTIVLDIREYCSIIRISKKLCYYIRYITLYIYIYIIYTSLDNSIEVDLFSV